MFAITSKYSGFTLIELLLVVSLSAILLAIGVPNLSAFVQNSRVRASAYELHSAVATARSEALRRRARVALCTSTNATSSDPSCVGASQDWSQGWLIFTSDDNGFNAATDLLLGVGTGSGTGLSIRTNATAGGAFAFRGDGTLDSAAGAVRLALCDGRGGTHGVQIDLSTLGSSTSWSGSSGPSVNCNDPA